MTEVQSGQVIYYTVGTEIFNAIVLENGDLEKDGGVAIKTEKGEITKSTDYATTVPTDIHDNAFVEQIREGIIEKLGRDIIEQLREEIIEKLVDKFLAYVAAKMPEAEAIEKAIQEVANSASQQIADILLTNMGVISDVFINTINNIEILL